jgi:para-nitrobenzyl esterase
MHIEGAPSNRGLLAKIAALQWVSNNIPGFGGHPDNVTVFGQSAGAASIGMLLVAPGAAGLFHRGIAESIPASLFGRDLAADIATVIAGELGCRPTVAELAATSPAALVTASADVAKAVTQYQGRWGYDVVVRGSVFGPVIDGAVPPDSPWRALAGGMGRDVALVIGHNSAEYNLAIALAGGPGQVTVAEANRALRLLPPVVDGAQAYRAAYPQAGHAELYGLVCSDFVYRMPSLHLAQSHAGGGGTTHLYEFRFDASPLGAAHTTEIPLVFGTLTSPVGPSSTVLRLRSQRWECRRKSLAHGVLSQRTVIPAGPPMIRSTSWPASSTRNPLSRVTLSRHPRRSGRGVRSTPSRCNIADPWQLSGLLPTADGGR